jgi:tRNA nucleotidyltransferase (CCA-adding enzyme)
VNNETFQEDPLRVLRGAQFAARFGFAIAEETRALSRTMNLDALSNERIMGETEKALLKAPAQSVFFEELREMNQLSYWYPELEALIGVPQNPEFHPEGDAWAHTMQVLDEAALVKDRSSHPLWFMLAALCHDLGKAKVTETVNGRIHAYGHDSASVPLAQNLIRRLTREADLLKYVLNLTQLHMQPNMMAAQHAREKGFMKLFDRAVSPAELLLLSRADFLGRQVDPADREALAAEYAPTEQVLREMLALFDARMARPFLQGRDLIAAGVEPGPRFHEALAYAHKLRLAGLDREEQLRQTLGYIRKK